ncbi:hypothetical protein [Bradyrhizobium sp. USDA 4350]
MFDAPKLARNFRGKPLETKRIAQFQWLIVEEEVEIDTRPEARSDGRVVGKSQLVEPNKAGNRSFHRTSAGSI